MVYYKIFLKVLSFIMFFPILVGMKQKASIEIKDNYPFYTRLHKEKKFLINKEVIISAKANNKNYLHYSCEATHEALPNKIEFIIRVNPAEQKKFEFKLLCNDLYKQPYFRFDSFGATHRNHKDSIYLPDQQIIPPHFHVFDDMGFSIAYKTDKLKDEAEAKALEDINLCVVHYCNEGNIRIKEDDFPNITINTENTLFGDLLVEDDPNENVNFT